MRSIASMATVLIVLSACEATTPIDVLPTKARVTLSVSPGTGPFGASQHGLVVASDLVQVLSGDSLSITRVAVVLRELELKRQFASGCPSNAPSSESCQRFSVGPLLLEVPVVVSITPVMTIDVPPGTYDEVEFDIHKPEDDDPSDNAFLQAHPDFEDVSIRVEGTFNGWPFVFLQDMGETAEADLVPPLVVSSDNPMTTNLTLTLDVASWFVSGDRLISPRTANKGEDNENLVRDNIRASIEAFEDRDSDGWRDGN